MNLSNYGIDALKRVEGCVMRDGRHVIYDDKTGQPVPAGGALAGGATIGYGHLIKPGENFRDSITEAVATELLRADVSCAEHAVRANIFCDLSQNQFDALVILAFNIGAKNFANSTVVKYINNPSFHSAQYPTLESAWLAWSKTGGRVNAGLIRRRNIELEIYKNAKYC